METLSQHFSHKHSWPSCTPKKRHLLLIETVAAGVAEACPEEVPVGVDSSWSLPTTSSDNRPSTSCLWWMACIRYHNYRVQFCDIMKPHICTLLHSEGSMNSNAPGLAWRASFTAAPPSPSPKQRKWLEAWTHIKKADKKNGKWRKDRHILQRLEKIKNIGQLTGLVMSVPCYIIMNNFSNIRHLLRVLTSFSGGLFNSRQPKTCITRKMTPSKMNTLGT